ncbi:RNA-directed DNA polymerase, eukaryota, reverse transcriptase zinc-binding domain protein [Tanacetum coccineum]|uniref:RNA-directed DNA polymerase, eukaryota, reverse transcriptase zinc-binding domain protein n=1 Tax=Tanacetum coccineum TaxID=301880 RepID=A0ABQ4X9U9_9ASTR
MNSECRNRIDINGGIHIVEINHCTHSLIIIGSIEYGSSIAALTYGVVAVLTDDLPVPIRKRNEESKGRNYNSKAQVKKGNGKDEGEGERNRNKFEVLNGCIKVKDWIQEIMKYYKNLLEMNKLMEIEDGNENIEDVLEANSGIAKYLSTTEVEGIERRSLWEDLRRSKLITNGCPWILMGDFNVTLKMDEHSAGGSKVNEDILEFRECVNDFEVEDSNWSGLFFTWIKSPSKPETSILKKLDRVMINADFINKYGDAFTRSL